MTASNVAMIDDFNPRSHEGSDLTIDASMVSVSDFNPRSHEGSDKRCVSMSINHSNFNPRSHEGSDSFVSLELPYSSISIHAPTRGATAIFAKKFSFLSAKIV